MSQMAKVVEGTAISEAVPTGIGKVSKAIGSRPSAWISPMARTRNGDYACARPPCWSSAPAAGAPDRQPRGSGHADPKRP